MSDLLHKDIFSMKEIDELNTSIASPVVSNPSKHKDKDTHTNREKKYTNVKRNRSESDEEESLSSSYEESNPYLNSEVFIEMNIIQLKRDLSLSFWLISLSMRFSSSIHVAANGIMAFFFMAE